jgi:hypothetical protein
MPICSAETVIPRIFLTSCDRFAHIGTGNLIFNHVFPFSCAPKAS